MVNLVIKATLIYVFLQKQIERYPELGRVLLDPVQRGAFMN